VTSDVSHRPRWRHGHKSFARDLGVLVKPAELNKSCRRRPRLYRPWQPHRSEEARLKHLLEKWTFEQYLEETEKVLGYQLERIRSIQPRSATRARDRPQPRRRLSAEAKGIELRGVAVPVGQITPKQLIRLARSPTSTARARCASRVAEFHHPECARCFVRR